MIKQSEQESMAVNLACKSTQRICFAKVDVNFTEMFPVINPMLTLTMLTLIS